MSKGKFALGALVGAAAGVVAGVLTAPKSGKETRADIKRKAGEIKEDATEVVDKAKTKATDVAGEVREKAEGYRDRAERAVSSAKKEFQEEAKKR